MKLRRNFLIIFILIFSLVGCQNLRNNEEKQNETNIGETGEETVKEDNTVDEEKTKEEIHRANLKFIGDILPHSNIFEYAKSRGNGEYNFDYNFELIREFTRNSDLVIANNEFSVNPEYPPSGYPQFVVPEEIYKSLKDIGVDIMTTANNHALDSYIDGLHYTMDAIRKYGMDNLGTQKNGEDHYLMKDINGIKVAILAYTGPTNGLDVILDTPEKLALLNRLDPEQIKADIEDANSKGAEFVIVYPHWGIEYSSYPEQDEINLARNMIEWGADLVIGNHPHVIQPKETYKAEDGRDGLIYYSVGNLLSNQTFETIEDYRVEHGLIVEVDIEKSSSDERARIADEKYHVTWLGRRHDEYGILNRVHLVDEFINNGPKSDMATEQEISRMEIAKDMTDKTVNTHIE